MKLCRVKTYDTDLFYKDLWCTLARDFRSTLGNDFCVEQEFALRKDVRSFRDVNYPVCYLQDTHRFKAYYQMKSLFKRYTFRHDKFNADDVALRTSQKFHETQIRIATGTWNRTYRSSLVITKARSIIRSILGEFDHQEHIAACRFARNATVHNPATESNLDRKLCGPVSATNDQLKWFKTILGEDHLLTDCMSSPVPFVTDRYTIVDALPLVQVPKKFDVNRTIMPNTTLGSYYTYGLGIMIGSRLKSIGIDIQRSQEKHRKIVRIFSKTLTHATADLSAASDSFTSELVNALVPRKWFNALRLGRCKYFSEGEKKYYLSSFCTMGIGFTFQLETLLFYGILKAIQELSHVKGFISVYGDDLIYPSSMHKYVVGIFSDINFILNRDKTFVKEPFRESCGGDYYYGCDVRPFQPEGVRQELSKKRYAVFLYKTLNGLLRRWSEYEIPQTRRFILLEILRVDSVIYQVPMDFPDHSGYKVESINRDPLIPWFIPQLDDNISYVCRFYSFVTPTRPVLYQLPFYWEKLQSLATCKDESLYGSSRDILRWMVVKTNRWRSRISNMKYCYRLVAHYDRKRSALKIVNQNASVINWR